MKTFTLNDKEYSAKSMDFNALCHFEKMGVDLSTIEGANFSFIRAYISYCLDVTPEEAGNEIQAHVNKYGWDSLGEILNNAITELSDEGFSETPKKVSATRRKKA